MKRVAQVLCLLLSLGFATGASAQPQAQKAVGQSPPSVTVTLVRWPYT